MGLDNEVSSCHGKIEKVGAKKMFMGVFQLENLTIFLDQLLENLAVTTSHHQQVKNTDD